MKQLQPPAHDRQATNQHLVEHASRVHGGGEAR